MAASRPKKLKKKLKKGAASRRKKAKKPCFYIFIRLKKNPGGMHKHRKCHNHMQKLVKNPEISSKSPKFY